MIERDYGFYRRCFDGLPMPFAFLDLDLFDTNIEAIARRAEGRRVRIASKSIRCISALRRILDAGPPFEGILAFTAPEALHLVARGFEDIVVAYPTWEPRHIEAAAAAAAEGTPVTLMVDSIAHVRHVDEIASRVGSIVPLCIDLDLSQDLPGVRLGAWRSPLRDPSDALAVAAAIAGAANVTLDGVMGYEAQVAGLPDRAPGARLKTPAIRVLKRRAARAIVERRAEIVHALRGAGHEPRFVNGGGTGSMEVTSRDTSVTEIAVGSGFYSPGLFDHYDSFRHLPAAGFAVQVVRRPATNVFTCLGGGYIASGAPGPDKEPIPYLPPGARLIPTEGAGEVQTPIRYDGDELDIGAPVFMRHAKAGELCERFTHLVLAADGRIVDQVPTYRGEGRSFL